MARSRKTLVHISLTMLSSKTRRAGACVPPHTIHTLATILTAYTELWGTFIHIHLTLQTFGARRTCTGEAVGQINAGASIATGIRLALVNIIFTIYALITCFTLAVISTLVVHTGPSISTGVGETFIHLAVTVTAHITSLTHTLVCVVFVDTLPCVLTHHVHHHTLVFGNSLAGHIGDITVQACPAMLTAASPIHLLLDARTSIITLNFTAQVHH